MSKENEGVKSVVVTFKCSPKFKAKLDAFAKNFDSRSEMIRDAIEHSMWTRIGDAVE